MGETIYIPVIGGAAPTPPSPTLFSTTGAVDTLYFGRMEQTDYTLESEILGLTWTSISAIATSNAQQLINQVDIGSDTYLKGSRVPYAATGGNNTYASFSHNLVNTSFNLLNTDSFTLVFQTKHETYAKGSTSCTAFLDFGSKGTTKAGFWIEIGQTDSNFYVYDDAAAFNRTRFLYPGGFSPWKSGQLITWTWKFNRANNYGTVTTKIAGASAVDQSANCSKPSGSNFSALGAVTFTGGADPNSAFFGSANSANPTTGFTGDVVQLAFAKGLTYSPGTLP